MSLFLKNYFKLKKMSSKIKNDFRNITVDSICVFVGKKCMVCPAIIWLCYKTDDTLKFSESQTLH